MDPKKIKEEKKAAKAKVRFSVHFCGFQAPPLLSCVLVTQMHIQSHSFWTVLASVVVCDSVACSVAVTISVAHLISQHRRSVYLAVLLPLCCSP